MQCVRSILPLAHTVKALPSSSQFATVRGLSWTRQLSSQSKNHRILVKSLPHASLDRSGGSFFAPNRNNASYHGEDFSLILKPFPRHLVDEKGNLDETRLLPHWLPLPPDPATHQGRHLRPPFYYPSPAPPLSTEEQGQDEARWEALPLTPPRSSEQELRPILRVFAMSTKKRIHKFAVIRHRTRTRLVAALRFAIARLHDTELDLAKALDVRKNMLMLLASPPTYAKDMDALTAEMEKALRRLTAPRPQRLGPNKKRDLQHVHRRKDTRAHSAR